MALRLLLVIDEIELGGAELSFIELCRALAVRSEVHLALSERSLKKPAIAALCTSGGIGGSTVHPIQARLYPGTISNLHLLFRRKPARELAGLIDRIRPACVIANLPTVERGQTIVDAARLSRLRPPVWGFLHLVQRPSTLGVKLGPLRDLMAGALIRRFDRILTVSHKGAREISDRYRMSLPAVIHPPTAPLKPVASWEERTSRRARENLSDGFLAGIVGRVQVRQKGHDDALRLVAHLTRQGHPITLVVIGDGPDLPAVRRLAEKLEITSHVRFLGWRQDAGALIPLLDVVLLPSHFEGMPQTALQSATARVPVIAYDVGGLPELLPPAFVVPHGEEGKFAEMVLKVVQGTVIWPSDEMAARAVTWGNPGHAAERLLGLLRQSSVV